MDYLRYEITKILSRKFFFMSSSGGNYEFKIVVWMNTKKYLKKDDAMKCWWN